MGTRCQPPDRRPLPQKRQGHRLRRRPLAVARGDATWTHLVATFRAPVPEGSATGNVALYQNGTLIGPATQPQPQYDSSMLLTIGGCINSASATTPYLAFPGSVIDVHVYPRTLSATEVSALH
ncbi:LamG-like jellyroll fold domain-containing protein [Streptomyces sp. NPDC001601]|uniref:LamG-like jellyroll fold domain-containing protein n=1 Tax=Streptomyces sp. NPDC001601 TaxID=3364592 RepID=UPI0036B84ECE